MPLPADFLARALRSVEARDFKSLDELLALGARFDEPDDEHPAGVFGAMALRGGFAGFLKTRKGAIVRPRLSPALFSASNPLAFAVQRNDLETCRALIALGAKTDFHALALCRDERALRLLAKSALGALRLRGPDGETPLHRFAQDKRPGSFFQTALDLGANPKARTEEGKTPFALALELGHERLFYLMEQAGCSINELLETPNDELESKELLLRTCSPDDDRSWRLRRLLPLIAPKKLNAWLGAPDAPYLRTALARFDFEGARSLLRHGALEPLSAPTLSELLPCAFHGLGIVFAQRKIAPGAWLSRRETAAAWRVCLELAHRAREKGIDPKPFLERAAASDTLGKGIAQNAFAKHFEALELSGALEAANVKALPKLRL